MTSTTACAPDRLLDRYARPASDPLDEVRSQAGKVFCDHRLRLQGAAQRLDARRDDGHVRAMGVRRLRDGAAVAIDPGMPRDFFLLQRSLCGTATIAVGTQAVHLTPSHASWVSPSLTFRMQHGSDTEKLLTAMRRGFAHRGQFSARDRRRFGELPSQTLARRDH